ncbi:M12 family metallopeptidase [Pseudomonas sp. MPR-ANC1]|uniref:M12 family metallopeptidase n=1 Tax=Pseudomonas sp. MPR-ANC1 TaxID=2075548 RepID=UPI002115513F|nr:M12 family metallopeptidase [Pseudomonas sp. MPR-ANC1]
MHTCHFVRMLEPGTRQEQARQNLPPQTRHRRSVAYSNSFWENASTVTFSFKEDVPANLRVRIEFCLRRWEPFISLALELVDDGDGQIRIAVEGNDSYSAIGTWALQEDPDEPTLVIGKSPDDRFFEQTILHEFGHALGFHHAHLHPDANIPWDKPAAYDFFKQNHGWSKAQVDHNFFNLDSRQSAFLGSYDRHSIMHYPTPEFLTYKKWDIGDNMTLSEGDKLFARQAYPALDYWQLPT